MKKLIVIIKYDSLFNSVYFSIFEYLCLFCTDFSHRNNGYPAIHYTDSILVVWRCAAVSGINSLDMHRHGKFSLLIFFCFIFLFDLYWSVAYNPRSL